MWVLHTCVFVYLCVTRQCIQETDDDHRLLPYCRQQQQHSTYHEKYGNRLPATAVKACAPPMIKHGNRLRTRASPPQNPQSKEIFLADHALTNNINNKYRNPLRKRLLKRSTFCLVEPEETPRGSDASCECCCCHDL